MAGLTPPRLHSAGRAATHPPAPTGPDYTQCLGQRPWELYSAEESRRVVGKQGKPTVVVGSSKCKADFSGVSRSNAGYPAELARRDSLVSCTGRPSPGRGQLPRSRARLRACLIGGPRARCCAWNFPLRYRLHPRCSASCSTALLVCTLLHPPFAADFVVLSTLALGLSRGAAVSFALQLSQATMSTNRF